MEKLNYQIKKFKSNDPIPDDAKFLRAYDIPAVYNAHTGNVLSYETIYEFLIPIKAISHD